MAQHKKPSKEELEANIKKIQEDLESDQAEETPEEQETPETPETPEETQDDIVEDVEEQEPTEQQEQPEEPTEQDVEEEQVEEPKKPVDYKKKFIASTQEARILYAKNRKISEAVEKANEVPEPTEAELEKEYSDWDIMSDTEKRLAKDSYWNKQRFAMLDAVTKEARDIDSWNSKVDTFITDPQTTTKYPRLEGRENEFKEFAFGPTRRGVDFNILVSSFLYEVNEQAPKKNKGKMFETGKSGPKKVQPVSDKISLDQANKLMKTNYNEYKRLLKAGKISMSIE